MQKRRFGLYTVCQTPSSVVRSYVWITRNQTQQFLTSIINIIRYQQQLHVSALYVGHHQGVTLDQV